MSDYLADLRATVTEGAERMESSDGTYTHSVGVMSPVLLALLDAAEALQALVGAHDGHNTGCPQCVGGRALARLRETGEQP